MGTHLALHINGIQPIVNQKYFFLKVASFKKLQLDVVVHACNLCTWEAKAGRSQCLGQPGLHTRPSLSKQKHKQK
jgi:hypothetical protein